METLHTIATWAAIFLLLEVIVLMAVPGVAFFFGWKGMSWVVRKTEMVLDKVESIVDGAERYATRGGRAAAAPMVWLYARAAWLRGFAEGLLRT